MPTSKPKLAQLTTPVTATFPSELQALSAKTPLSAVPDALKEEFTKTPISPPTAYMDFLKTMSPVVPEKRSGSSTEEEDDAAQDSMPPSTASSEQTDCSCTCGNHKSPTSAISPTSYPTYPLSAPPTGATSFPSLHIPPSPAISNVESPLSATARSPFSARSTRSPFDWEAALKARFSQDCKAAKPSSRSIRHIREVVTRTVTYTPRMKPAPKGKRRKTDCGKAAKPQTAPKEQKRASSTDQIPPKTAPPIPTTRSNSA